MNLFNIVSVAIVLLSGPSDAWTGGMSRNSANRPVQRQEQQQEQAPDQLLTRQDMLLRTMGGVVAGWALTTAPTLAAESLPSGVTYEVVKSGDGAKPEVGELVAIRFAAYCGSIKIDDIFDTAEPYYTRLGSGGLIKGVETTLPLMRLGDRWKLTIPVSPYIVFWFSTKETKTEKDMKPFFVLVQRFLLLFLILFNSFFCFVVLNSDFLFLLFSWF